MALVPLEFGICLEKCPKAGDVVADFYGEYGTWTVPIDTTNVLGYCIPIDDKLKERFAEETFADIIRAKVPIGVLAFPVAVVLAFLFTQLIRYYFVNFTSFPIVPFLNRMCCQNSLLAANYCLGIDPAYIRRSHCRRICCAGKS